MAESGSTPGQAVADHGPDTSLRAGGRLIRTGIRREPRIFAVATAGSLLFGALTVADAWVLGWATDHAIVPAFANGEIGAGVLWTVTALFVGVALLRALGIVARRIGGGVFAYRLMAHSRRAVNRQYLALPMSWHQRHPTGQLLSNANSDVEAQWAPTMPLPFALGTLAMMIIAAVQMLLTDAVLAIVGLLVFPAVIVANVVYQRVSSPLYTSIQALRAELSEIAHESFDGAMVVKTLGREAEETRRFQAKARELRDYGVRAGRVRAVFDPALEAIPSLAVLAVLAFGVARIDAGLADPGDLVTIAYLLTVVAFPIRSIGWVVGELPRALVGDHRVRSVLEARAETTYGAAVLPGEGGGALLEVDGVGYGYTGDEPVLDDLTLAVEPGRTVALVGPTASGKSTLGSLLLRLVDPDQGEIRVDGVDLRELRPGALAAHAALVPQTAFLFDDTVRGNVTLGEPVDDAEVWAALRTAQAEGFVRALPHGLDTRIGERGTSLSGGQRQRISLARALVRRPRLLVLDDATSAVDPDVEARILAAMREGAGAATMLLVAYRKATISLADEVLFLDGGRIVDRGTHRALLDRNPDYARLVNAYETEDDQQPQEVGS